MRASVFVLSVLLAAFSVSVLAERDLEGIWVNTNATPLARPPGYTQLFISAAEARAIDVQRPEQRPTQERCIGPQASLPPLLSIPTASLHLIVQTPQATVIFAEWMQQTRVIRMNAQHVHPTVTSWLGDSIGWWEGDTLVVDSQFHAQRSDAHRR
jgi:hypothetical protein